MVVITKQGKSLRVSEGAYHTIFKPLGYQLLSEAKIEPLTGETHFKGSNTQPNDFTPKSDEEIDAEEDEETDASISDEEEDEEYETEEDDDLEETPLSEMTIAQMKAYADLNEIDLGEAKKAAEIREVIKAALED